ncbi:hypothetical protein FS749_007634 [Ceratobasidium sp. UAMH 11750]|nr:hypothetical protein FS749_007634 [Ceratobasidium sp. UAMH 11750]
MVSAPASALALGHPHLSARSRSLVAILGLRMWDHCLVPLDGSPSLALSRAGPRAALVRLAPARQNPALTLYLAHVFVGSCVPTLAFAPVLALLAHARPLSVMRALPRSWVRSTAHAPSHPLVRMSPCSPTHLSLAQLARGADTPTSSPALSTSARHVSYPLPPLHTAAPPIALA